ncbi:helix-turn-helix transcriptional regulator [Hathewaya limosa]|uniref:DNA-binding transcriptional regulator YafY n=1 Tax=Hathewaya limosa TaxID=1536 RepID=A0ABU0JT27_HATLI|nr:HTH domain-containing protein [Hathewaya limosa]MDQ0479082.1 putative DNA-binding transcriptional regulator YafY [Hathewaya limosa]
MIRNRQLELLLYLLKNKKTTYKQLAREFEVSTKTIERDIDRLSAMGVPVQCIQGKHGGVFIDEKYKLSTSFFTNEDIQDIIFALTAFDSFGKKQCKENILKKLCMIAPELVGVLENDSKEYFVCDLVSEKVDMQSEICKNINECMNKDVFLKISFNNYKAVVAPISYVLKPDGLYLYCFNDEYYLISISKIKHTEITENEFIRDFIPYKENKKFSR